ncbi:hypothetical protein P9112_006869 [Eukaryota sp. TZLM1-RC]
MSFLELQNSSLTSLEDIKPSSDVTSINLSFNNLESLSGIDKFPNLEHLNLSHNDSLIDLTPLSTCKNLTGLTFSRNNLPSLTSLLPLSCLNLTSLVLFPSDLASTKPSKLYYYYLLSIMPSLQQIDARPISSDMVVTARNYFTTSEAKELVKKYHLKFEFNHTNISAASHDVDSTLNQPLEVGEVVGGVDVRTNKGFVCCSKETSLIRNSLIANQTPTVPFNQLTYDDVIDTVKSSPLVTKSIPRNSNQISNAKPPKSTNSTTNTISYEIPYNSKSNAVTIFSDGTGIGKRRRKGGSTAVDVSRQGDCDWSMKVFYSNSVLAILVNSDSFLIQNFDGDVVANLKTQNPFISKLKPFQYCNFFKVSDEIGIIFNYPKFNSLLQSNLEYFDIPINYDCVVLFQPQQDVIFYFVCGDLLEFQQFSDGPTLPIKEKAVVTNPSYSDGFNFGQSISDVISGLDEAQSGITKRLEAVTHSTKPRPVVNPIDNQSVNQNDTIDQNDVVVSEKESELSRQQLKMKQENQRLQEDRAMLADFRKQLKLITDSLP